MVNDSPDDTISLHLAKLLNEHLLRNPCDRALQVREAPHLATEEVEEDH